MVAPSVKAVILVGGPSRGTRFRPLSLNCPKPLFPIGGQPLLYHHLQSLSAIPNLKDVYLIGFFEDQIFSRFLENVLTDFPSFNVRCVFHRDALQHGVPCDP
jgi:mannose-1-phosphate guanylyltransferase